jgi:hypothetical protein
MQAGASYARLARHKSDHYASTQGISAAGSFRGSRLRWGPGFGPDFLVAALDRESRAQPGWLPGGRFQYRHGPRFATVRNVYTNLDDHTVDDLLGSLRV